MMFTDYQKFSVDIVTDFTPGFIEYVVDLCEPYSRTGKDKKELYSPEKMKACFKLGRFDLGFCIVKYDGDVVATIGIDNFNQWAMMTRYLRHARTGILEPIFFGVCLPFIIQHFHTTIKGVCWTQNTDKRDLAGVGIRRFTEAQNSEQLYIAAARYSKQIIKLNDPVWYRSVEQQAFYIPLTHEVPPFVKQPTRASNDQLHTKLQKHLALP